MESIQLGLGASIQYQQGFISSSESARLLNKWTTELDWTQSEITMFGKKVAIPRLNTWYGERDYSYSGTHFEAKPWTPELKALKEKIEKCSGLIFNSALINWYRDGQDCMGWHSDDEASLGHQPQIASVSLGDNRKFVFREKQNKRNKINIVLQNGSLLLMLGSTQLLWQHSLPRTTKSAHSRINLTFRLVGD